MFYDDFFSELYKNKVRYLLSGGHAVNIYGVIRSTYDIDILLDLSEENIGKFLKALKNLDMIPSLPVDINDIKSETARNGWVNEKNLIVFNIYKRNEPYHSVDVFLKSLINFDELFERKKIIRYDDFEIYVVNKNDLITLKSIAGRDKDNEDIKELKKR
ncbi:MAG: DUF6036 family nucleotidyltransferase [Candidatus Acidulodesulfobacterium sp.]